MNACPRRSGSWSLELPPGIILSWRVAPDGYGRERNASPSIRTHGLGCCWSRLMTASSPTHWARRMRVFSSSDISVSPLPDTMPRRRAVYSLEAYHPQPSRSSVLKRLGRCFHGGCGNDGIRRHKNNQHLNRTKHVLTKVWVQKCPVSQDSPCPG